MAEQLLHVAVGLVRCRQKGILISLRQKNQHLAGLWEFPGGKLEPSETVTQALARELYEEVGIEVLSSKPLIQIVHHYREKSVLLDVHIVDDFSGTAAGREGQKIQWVVPEALKNINFPPANESIINALLYPDKVLITGLYDSLTDFQLHLLNGLKKGVGMVQFRTNTGGDLDESFLSAKKTCEEHDVKLAINSRVSKHVATTLFSHTGLHLTSEHLHSEQIDSTPFAFVGASCHTLADIQRANTLKLDYVYLSPVLATQSHPMQNPMGWQFFSELAIEATMPVYALGGLSGSDVEIAKTWGGQGIAGITCFWSR